MSANLNETRVPLTTIRLRSDSGNRDELGNKILSNRKLPTRIADRRNSNKATAVDAAAVEKLLRQPPYRRAMPQKRKRKVYNSMKRQAVNAGLKRLRSFRRIPFSSSCAAAMICIQSNVTFLRVCCYQAT